jgi:hypothetical protein
LLGLARRNYINPEEKEFGKTLDVFFPSYNTYSTQLLPQWNIKSKRHPNNKKYNKFCLEKITENMPN